MSAEPIPMANPDQYLQEDSEYFPGGRRAINVSATPMPTTMHPRAQAGPMRALQQGGLR